MDIGLPCRRYSYPSGTQRKAARTRALGQAQKALRLQRLSMENAALIPLLGKRTQVLHGTHHQPAAEDTLLLPHGRSPGEPYATLA